MSSVAEHTATKDKLSIARKYCEVFGRHQEDGEALMPQGRSDLKKK